ncbi:hypothetical protein EVAR_42688_1 [Eumeta japonica]|uniref:Uncharacterized protein n=1 Tax=Eumeta variegata TaxID=151549 RepID=A0A4C1WY65_EUMVA|nr:hypothetical protein EVAR_42688_1 [Eumeta japonica]
MNLALVDRQKLMFLRHTASLATKHEARPVACDAQSRAIVKLARKLGILFIAWALRLYSEIYPDSQPASPQIILYLKLNISIEYRYYGHRKRWWRSMFRKGSQLNLTLRCNSRWPPPLGPDPAAPRGAPVCAPN